MVPNNSIVVQQGEKEVTIESEAELNNDLFGVAWSPNGDRLAAAVSVREIVIWDANTGRRLRQLPRHSTELTCVLRGVLTEKNLAATGYEPGTITIWDVDTGEERAVFTSGQFNYCLSWSPDSRQLAVGTYMGNTFVWDVTSGEKLLSLSGPGKTRAISWSPDGSRLATSANTIATIRDAISGKVQRTIRHEARIRQFAWSPDSQRIAVGDQNEVVKVWDTTEDQGVRTIAQDGELGGIAFSPDDGRLAYRAIGESIKICDVETGKGLHDFPGPAGSGLRPVWSPDCKYVACGGDDGLDRCFLICVAVKLAIGCTRERGPRCRASVRICV